MTACIVLASTQQKIDLPPGRKWFLPNQTDGPAKELIKHGTRSQGLLDEVKCLVDAKKGIIDAGANLGTFTIEFAPLTTANMYTFEPQRKVYMQLCANIAINALENVEAYPVALGSLEQDGTSVGMYENVPGSTEVTRLVGAQLPSHWFGSTDKVTEQVQVHALDKILQKPIGLIKIDVEGYEVQVLQGCMGILKRDKPNLLIEAFDDVDVFARPTGKEQKNGSKSQCFTLLRSLDYYIIRTLASQTDYVCIHKDSTALAPYIDQHMKAAKACANKHNWKAVIEHLVLLPFEALNTDQTFRYCDEIMLAEWFADNKKSYDKYGQLLLNGLASGKFDLQWKQNHERLRRNFKFVSEAKWERVEKVKAAKFSDVKVIQADCHYLVECNDFQKDSYWTLPHMNPQMIGKCV